MVWGGGKDKSDDEEQGRRGKVSRGVNQNMVYFECDVCGFEFQDDPNKDFQKCPQCDSEETFRV